MNAPAAPFLFETNDQQVKLDNKKMKIFHTFVAKLLLVSKRGQTGIQVAIAFLSTRITGPDTDDWKKLVQLMKYLNGTKEMVLTLSEESFNSIKWWVDISYTTHQNCKGHTGGTLSIGKESIYSTS